MIGKSVAAVLSWTISLSELETDCSLQVQIPKPFYLSHVLGDSVKVKVKYIKSTYI